MRPKSDQQRVVEAERVMQQQNGKVRNAHYLIVSDEVCRSYIAGFVCGSAFTFLVLTVLYGCYVYFRTGL